MKRWITVILGIISLLVWHSTYHYVSAAKCVCPPIPEHYRGLNCVPVYHLSKDGVDINSEYNNALANFEYPEDENYVLETTPSDVDYDTSCCPLSYKCPDFKNECYINGKSYPQCSLISIEYPCSFKYCFCATQIDRYLEKDTKQAILVCTHHEKKCPATEIRPKSARECHIIRNDSCCDKYICDDELEKRHKCYYNNEIYYEGEFFETDQCFTCRCNATFNNATDVTQNENCHYSHAGYLEQFYIMELRKKCTPIYESRNSCLPFDWMCIIPTKAPLVKMQKPIDSKRKCVLGKKSISYGIGFTDISTCVQCICLIPPMLTCTKISLEECSRRTYVTDGLSDYILAHTVPDKFED